MAYISYNDNIFSKGNATIYLKRNEITASKKEGLLFNQIYTSLICPSKLIHSYLALPVEQKKTDIKVVLEIKRLLWIA